MDEERMTRVIAAAMTAVETGRSLKPALTAILVKEIIRQRRHLEAQERKIRRLEGKDEMGSDK